MAQAVLPTLNSTVSIVTDIHEITAMLVRFVLYNPGSTSSTHEEEIISFRKIASEFGDDKDKICEVLRYKFREMLKRYFPTYDILAEFTYSPHDSSNTLDPRYRVVFDISYKTPQGQIIPGILGGSFTVDSENRIMLNFGNGEQ